MKLCVRINATTKRQRWAYELQNMLGIKAQIIWSKSGDLWGGVKYTLEQYEQDDTHMLIVQDDVLPCKHLTETAERLAELRPNNPITLFTNRPRVEQCKAQGLPWLRVGKWLMTQAYIVPIPMIVEFLKYCDEHIDDKIYYDDNRWAMFCWYNKIDVFATAPSLVEHLGWNSTSHGHYNADHDFEPRLRMAKWFLGFENSGMDVNWENLNFVDDPDGNNADFCSYLK